MKDQQVFVVRCYCDSKLASMFYISADNIDDVLTKVIAIMDNVLDFDLSIQEM